MGVFRAVVSSAAGTALFSTGPQTLQVVELTGTGEQFIFAGGSGRTHGAGNTAPGGGELELIAPYNQPEGVRGLEEFSHLWIVFVFHQTIEGGWRPTVRPPRLGGNARMGVFATRSTFRPNPIGMSLVELKSVETKGGKVILKLGSLDLVDGTPIIDIKPYLPFAESQPQARCWCCPICCWATSEKLTGISARGAS